MHGKALNSIQRTYDFIRTHPLGSRHTLRALNNWLGWQIRSRLSPGSLVVPFVGETKLLVQPGMHGATGNIYCGLHEFTDMAFVMHFLRERDLFLDVGANIGSYTILASGVCRARTIAIEPVAATAAALAANIGLNNAQDRVRLERCAVGEESGTVTVSDNADCVNHVLSPSEVGEFPEMPLCTLDDLLGDEAPILIKMDIEGYEYPALRGAKRVLANSSLQAVLVEANGSGRRYGHTDQQIFTLLNEAGFQRATYDPFHRLLQPATEARKGSANALFLRDFEFARTRVLAADRFFVLGEEL